MSLKEVFFCYYPPTEEDFSLWWKTGLFVFDANILLDLYGLQETTRNEFFTFLESFNDRIWLPHQVGLEFSRNRVKVISQQVNKYKAVIGRLERMLPGMMKPVEEARKELEDSDVPETVREIAQCVSANFEALLRQISEITVNLEVEVSPLIEKLEAERNAQTKLIENDPILDRLTALIGEKIGRPYSKEELGKIYAEGAARYDADPQIPPGFKDKNNPNKKGNDKYGDLVLWKQTIDEARAKKVPILLVSNEQKTDWVEPDSDGRKPRVEIVQEMYQEAGVAFHLYTLTQFMESAKAYLGVTFTVTSISDASRIEQEERKNIANYSEENLNALCGNFILAWREVERYLSESAAQIGVAGRFKSPVQLLDTLRSDNAISARHHNRLVWLSRVRNNILHNTGNLPSEEKLRELIEEIQEIVEELGILQFPKDHIAVNAVSLFLTKMFSSTTLSTQKDRPYLFLHHEDKAAAVDVVFIEAITPDIINTLNESLNIGDSLVASGNVDKFILVIVGKNFDTAIRASLPYPQSQHSPYRNIWTGYLENKQFILVTNENLVYPLFEQI